MRTKVNYGAVPVAAVTSLVASAVYYTVLGDAYQRWRSIDPSTAEMTPQLWQMTGQFARNLVVAFVLAYLLSRLGVTTPKGALRLGFLVWFGFEAMAVVGSGLHEDYPLGLYVIHVGDALMATLLMALILAPGDVAAAGRSTSVRQPAPPPERCSQKASKQRSA